MNRKFFGPNSCVMASVVVRKSSIVAMNLNACLKKDGKRFLWVCFVLTCVIPENASAKGSLSNAEYQL